MIKTKRIYDPATPADGYRLLVMRRWPRGIRKSTVDGWEKELGPSPELLNNFRKELVACAEFTDLYHAEMASKRQLITEVRELSERGDLTLLCSCVDDHRCHRTLLKAMLEEELAS